MFARFSAQRRGSIGVLLLLAAVFAGGCSRTKYRLQADQEAYHLLDSVAAHNTDPAWNPANYNIELNRRSRFFDPHDPDCSPMPRDDPDSAVYMRKVNGYRGWRHWEDNGFRFDLENPEWRARLTEYVGFDGEGAIDLNVDSALRLAYTNSPDHQRQLETLYLSALDVSAERFRLDAQFFGGYDTFYGHNGSIIPAGLGFNPVLRRFVINPPIEGPGVENNRLTVGRPFAGDPALLATRRLATAGELLAGFANSFVLEFTGGDASLAASIANFSFVQPLLRGAGRDIALEQLTFVERNLLANLRAYSQFRQGFYTRIAVGELGVAGPQRGGRGTSLQVFNGQGGLGGYLGLLQQLQQIRNTEDNLGLQLRTLSQLVALEDVGVIDLVQVDRFRQSIEDERARLLLSQNSLQFSLDQYKTETLGLPPDLPVRLDASLIDQFQLVSREATQLQDAITFLQDEVGFLPENVSIEIVYQVLMDLYQLIEPVRRQLQAVRVDLTRMEEAAPFREALMTDLDLQAFRQDRMQLATNLVSLELRFEARMAELEFLRVGLNPATRVATVEGIVVWLGDLLRLTQQSVLEQARARLETVTIEAIELNADQAIEIALSNRLDFKNGRAALVDRWRLIQFNADALQSVLDISAAGDIRTARNNPVSFRGPTADLRLGIEFDAPFTRLLERNEYREALIDFQRSRREYIQSRDRLHLGLRELLRRSEQLRQNLEIQRRAVAIAIRRVDFARASLYAPVPPPEPGARAAAFGPTLAFDLLSALTSLRQAQDNFLGVWLQYYATRLRLSRELGIMELDEEGRWLDNGIPRSQEEFLQSINPRFLEELAPPGEPSELVPPLEYP